MERFTDQWRAENLTEAKGWIFYNSVSKCIYAEHYQTYKGAKMSIEDFLSGASDYMPVTVTNDTPRPMDTVTEYVYHLNRTDELDFWQAYLLDENFFKRILMTEWNDKKIHEDAEKALMTSKSWRDKFIDVSHAYMAEKHILRTSSLCAATTSVYFVWSEEARSIAGAYGMHVNIFDYLRGVQSVATFATAEEAEVQEARLRKMDEVHDWCVVESSELFWGKWLWTAICLGYIDRDQAHGIMPVFNSGNNLKDILFNFIKERGKETTKRREALVDQIKSGEDYTITGTLNGIKMCVPDGAGPVSYGRILGAKYKIYPMTADRANELISTELIVGTWFATPFDEAVKDIIDSTHSWFTSDAEIEALQMDERGCCRVVDVPKREAKEVEPMQLDTTSIV